MKVFQTIYMSSLTFVDKSWVLCESEKIKIQAVEMKFTRRVMGISRKGRIRIVDSRSELGIRSTLKFIEGSQLSWCGDACSKWNRQTPWEWTESKNWEEQEKGRRSEHGIESFLKLWKGRRWNRANLWDLRGTERVKWTVLMLCTHIEARRLCCAILQYTVEWQKENG